MILISKETKTSEFLVALKVVKELLINKEMFSIKYSGYNFASIDVRKSIDKLCQFVSAELVDDIKHSTPTFAIYISSF